MKIIKLLQGILPAAALIVASGVLAGNIPQYSFTENRDGFEFLTNPTEVKVTFNTADEMVFPGKQTITAFTGEGFPIGFDFRFGGQVFNQFAINNNGYLLLGYDKVQFRGYSNLFFRESATRYASNCFYMGIGPSMYGIKEGNISYKLEGTAGNRTMTVQFAHMGVNEPNPRGNAIYTLQIVLMEKDNSVKFNFLEEETPYSSLGMVCGIYGWSNTDSILLTSPSLGVPAKISTSKEADMIAAGSTLRWDADDPVEDRDDPYSFTFTFTPTGENDFVCESPADLTVEQTNDLVTVSCARPEDAPATVIMFSETPILKFPEQGLSYQVVNDEGDYVTKIDGATLIYYSNDENPVATFKGVKASTRYYVKAFGVNGYPSYSTETSSDLEFMTSHPAPYVIQTESADNAINIKTIGDDDVVIAVTLNRVNTANEGATGIFGQPADDCKAGDEIEGGGEIIYVGAPGDFTYADAVANRQNFFRAWSLKDGVISKTYINASGVTNPTMPYVPELELYTLYETPLNWIAQTTSTSSTVTTNFMPRTRGDEEEPVIGGVSEMATTATLISPLLTLGKDAKISFEWAMETVRELGDQGDALVQLPEGNEPGVFGTGHSFRVTCGQRGTENTLFTATEYKGKMAVSPNDEDHYISGTSEFIPVQVDVPASVTKARFRFEFSTEGFSTLYLRRIQVTDSSNVGVSSIFNEAGEDVIEGGIGNLTILSALGGEYNVYSIDGRHVASFIMEKEEGRVVALEKGVYVVGNKKIVVR